MKQAKKIALALALAMSVGISPSMVMAQEVSLIELTRDMPIKVTVEHLSYIEKEGELSNIIIEERIAGCLTSERDKEDRTLVLSLKGTPYSFSSLPSVKTEAGFKDLTAKTSYGETDGGKDRKLLYIVLPRDTSAKTKGRLTISGIKVEAAKMEEGDLDLEIGLLSEEDMTAFQVAKAAEYGIELTAKRVAKVVAGDNKSVDFEIAEKLPNSFVPNANLEISLDKGYFRQVKKDQIDIDAILLNGKNITSKVEVDPRYKEDVIVGFEIKLPDFDSKKCNTLKFEGLQLCAKASDRGEVTLTASGRGIPNKQSVTIGEIQESSKITIQKVNGLLGVKNQRGGAITITESSAGMLNKGIIEIQFEGAPYIIMSKKPTVEVVEGDVKVDSLGWDDKVDNLLRLQITKTSRKTSVIKISDFNFSVSNTSPDGGYKVSIGGEALWPEKPEERQHLEDFIMVSEKSTDLGGNPNSNPGQSDSSGNNKDNSNNSNRQITVFSIGSSVYIKNGKAYQMDTTPLALDGRTMVPVRYVAEAVGINSNAIKFSKGKITIPGESLIEMNLGSRIITVNGQLKTMATAPISIGGRIFVPVSEIATLLDVQVEWNSKNKTATFTK